MAARSSIEWTEATWNPVTGCTRVSEGCDHCYAVVMSRRLAAIGLEKYDGLINPGKSHFNGRIKMHFDTLTIPTARRKPTTYFVNSMSDLFHPGVTDDFIEHVFATMWRSPQHTFQILTKRPDRMASLLGELKMPDGHLFADRPLANVWLGTSVENQKVAEERIPALLAAPASIRFLSCEPLLGEVDLSPWLQDKSAGAIHWVIVGGESGKKARPIDADWVRRIRDACESADVDFFFKQWGGKNKKKAGRVLDGRVHDEMPAPRRQREPDVVCFASNS